MPAERFVLEGYADTQSLAANDTAENRARNRRVEIIVLKSSVLDEVTKSVDEITEEYDEIEGEITIIQ